MEDRKEMGLIITEEGTFISKDFCVVALINDFYDNRKKVSDEAYEYAIKFGRFLELYLGIHDGRIQEPEDN